MVEYIPETKKSDSKEGAASSSSATVRPSTAATLGGERKGKRRKTVVWSVNVLTVVLYLVDPRYMVCVGRYKQVSKRFKKACEIVLRVIVHEASQYIEYSAPLVMNLEREYLQSPTFTSIRRIWSMLKNVKIG